MKRVIKIVCALLFSFNVNAQNTDVKAIINKAGSQRALSQKMAKDYMLIGLGIRKEESAKELDQIMATFNENLHAIIFFDKSKKAEKAINKVNEIWSDYRVHINETPNKENAVQIIKTSTELMNACNDVVASLIESNSQFAESLKLIGTCGSQRRNAERMTMLYVAKAWGVNYDVSEELNATLKDFETNLDLLIKNKSNTPEIDKILEFHRVEWIFMKKAVDVTATVLKPEQLASSTGLVFRDFNTLTSMYEKL